MVKNPPANAGDIKDVGSIPGLGRFPDGGHGNPLQYPCLENPMDRGAWRATVHRVTNSYTWLKCLSMHKKRRWLNFRTNRCTFYEEFSLLCSRMWGNEYFSYYYLNTKAIFLFVSPHRSSPQEDIFICLYPCRTKVEPCGIFNVWPFFSVQK